MHFDPGTLTGNHLLDATPLDDLVELAPDLEWVDLTLRQVISQPGQAPEFAYFATSGIFSIISMVAQEDQIEMGLVGREGFLGTSILLMADRDPFRVIVQAPGRALRMPAQKMVDASVLPAFRAILLRYIQVFLVQAASTILANASYLVEERLARWILMAQDRVGSPNFPMTHEFMSLMLGVRRAGVTDAVHSLESRQLVRATRGQMHVLDRPGLEALADGSYGQAEREHRRLIVPRDSISAQ
jgi:CRP-like cAMP-binding protein